MMSEQCAQVETCCVADILQLHHLSRNKGQIRVDFDVQESKKISYLLQVDGFFSLFEEEEH